ncbi:MAG: N-acetylmuramoyl-L-alanine amidase [Firmicutes bacterium]|nr:N-acetylmuramoyl-L-alanine amidase [Bacillota bacterium]
MKICIDPGHGGNDEGVQAFGLLEKNITLDIAVKLKNFLEQEGVEVVLTREKDETVELKDRIGIINESGANYIISIHCNSGHVSDKGAETIYKHGSEEGEELANNILKEISKLEISSRRAYYKLNAQRDDYFLLTREANPVSVIVEVAFITNPSDNHLLSQNSYRKKIANAIAIGVFHTMNINKQKAHWAQKHFSRMKESGIVVEDHPLDSKVTWGELSMVISRLMDRLGKK